MIVRIFLVLTQYSSKPQKILSKNFGGRGSGRGRGFFVR